MESAPATIPATSARDLQLSVAPAGFGQAHVLTDQIGQPGPISQRHHRHKHHGGHQIVLIKTAGNRVRSVGESVG